VPTGRVVCEATENTCVCGIVGVFDSGAHLPSPERFASCLDRLQRRGPDDAGTWSNSVLRLGHRRLAIIDLSPTGHQPMVSTDGRFVIVFNGEIYNHGELRPQLAPPGGWAGSSDTETLLEAYRQWGPGCLERLNGMFAFAIWDNTERRLFVARDRMGVKPLYYSWSDGRFVFASRPSAMTGLLTGGGAEIDPQSLRIYLELGYIPAPLSLYRKVRKLPPGHWMSVDARGVRTTRYWDYRHISPDASLLKRSEDELVDELDELIRRATRLRLMSDVPLGAFLSGGVDSAYVVAAMKAVGVTAPKAFSIAFKEEDYNEGPAAIAIARHIGVDHVVETLSVRDLLELLPLYVDEFDEPFADSSAFPTMAVARLARRHVTVALTGDAGDELFGGYHYYPLIESLARTRDWPHSVKRLLQATLSRMPMHKAKLLAGALGPSTRVGIFNYLRSFAKDFSPLVDPDVLEGTGSSNDVFERTALGFPPGLTSAEVGMRLDLGLTLVDGYLQKVDVATMALSLEARCPFVDYRMVEWSMRLPVEFKLRGRHTKYLLKKGLCRYLPPSYVYRPKRGFGVPVAQWLRGPLRSWAENLLYDDSLVSRLPLEKARLRELFRLHTSGARDAHPLLWAALMLLCYVARHERGTDLPPVASQRAA
jgi:asparagine synthase (glutamine-hydrolysing)